MDQTPTPDRRADQPSGDVDCWINQVRTQLRVLAGPWVDEADAVWAGFATRPLVRISLHGGYDAGKSSLLKRILVDDGTPIPQWLGVGARPTTSDLDEIESAGLTWVDSPGMAAGRVAHDGLAEQALMLTDGLLVVLPPQLLSGDANHLPSLLDGSFHNPFARRPLFPTGALAVAVAQLDTAGVNPEDDPEGYQQLLERKRTELAVALDRAGVALPAKSLHLVAADPDQAGLLAHPTEEDYAGREAWDGVADLRAAMQALAPRHAELRSAAAARYWSRLGSEAHARAEAERHQLEEVTDGARRAQQATDLLLTELQALDEAARSQLHDRLRAALDRLTLPAGDPDAQRHQLEEQLDLTVDAWLADHGGRLEQFARASVADQQLRAERPGSAALRTYLDALLNDLAVGPPADDTLRTLLERFGEHSGSLAENAFTLIRGITPHAARAELERFRAGRVAESVLTGADAITSAEQATAVQHSLGRLEAVTLVLPIALELGRFGLDMLAERKSEQDRIELRAQLRKQADAIARHVLDSGLDMRTWADAVASVRTAILAQQVPAEVTATAQKRQQVLDDVLPALTKLLGEVPS
jgi:hypothetical protein